MAVLAKAAAAGATQLAVSVTCSAPFFIVGKNLQTAELCETQSLVGNTLTLKQPLANAHSAKEIVHPFDGGLVPAVWFGLRMGNLESDAPVNTAVLNGLSQRIYDLGLARGLVGIRIDGQFYVDNVIRLERDQILEGGSPTSTVIRAASSFPFDATGETAVIVGYRDGLKVQYAVAGATGRWYLRNFQINCLSRPNSNGILMSVQQPCSWTDVRVDEAKGLYGICIADSQQHRMNGITIVDCNVGLRYRNASFVYCYDLNIEHSDSVDFLAEGIGPNPTAGCHQNHFIGVHMEDDKPVVNFDIGAGRGWIFKNVWITQVAGSTTWLFRAINPTERGIPYTIESAQWGNSEDNLAIDDRDRGVQVRVYSDLKRHMTLTLAGVHNYASDSGNTPGQHALWVLGRDGKQVRIGAPGIGSGLAPNIRSTVPAGAFHEKLYDTTGKLTAQVGSTGAWDDLP